MSLSRKDLLGLLGWIVLTFAAAALAGIASAQAGTFYAQLARPDWAPPASLFAPVWSALYLMMAVAAWLIWRTRGGLSGARGALALFVIQLAANALWTWLFFVWRLGAGAFIEIVILWVLIVATVIGFWRIKPLAAVLLLPYLAWVSFATALTYSTWQRNPQLLSGWIAFAAQQPA